MGAILVVYKVFPEDIVEDFEPLKEKIKAIIPEHSAIEGSFPRRQNGYSRRIRNLSQQNSKRKSSAEL